MVQILDLHLFHFSILLQLPVLLLQLADFIPLILQLNVFLVNQVFSEHAWAWFLRGYYLLGFLRCFSRQLPVLFQLQNLLFLLLAEQFFLYSEFLRYSQLVFDDFLTVLNLVHGVK